MKAFKWRKMGRIFNPLEHERPFWGVEFALAPSTLVLDDVVRVYFSCRSKRDENQEQVSYSSFIDLNKENLKEITAISDHPIAPLGELGSFDEFGIVMTSVLAWKEKVYSYYIGWSRMRSVPYATAIGMLESHNDGVDFHRIGKGGPIITASLHSPMREHACPIVRRFNDQFYMWHMAGIKWIKDEQTGKIEPQYQITYSISQNTIDWTPQNDFVIPPITEDECQTTPNVFFKDGYYHMFFSYRRALDFRTNVNRSYRIGYAYSQDLKSWTRNDALAGIDISAEGWDSEMICYPHIFELNGKWIMLYNGNHFGREGFGYAELIED